MHASLVILFLAAAQPQTWNFKTGPKADVSVSNIAGTIKVEGTKGDEVSVEALVTAQDPSQWTVDVRGEGQRVQAKVCCGPCESKHHDCRSKDGAVDFTLRIPEKSSLRVHGVSSDITVSGATGPEEIHSVSGNIKVSGSEASLQVRSVSGTVQIAPKSLDEMNVNTVSGDVQIRLPDNPDATVQLKTVSGKLNGRRVGIGSSENSFGKATAKIRVTTVSGSVQTDPASI